MKRFFKWLLLLTTTLALGLVLLLYNPVWIKGPLERQLSELAGYPISLEGKLEINTGRQIELTATGVHISAPEWASHSDLLTLGHLKLTLNTASLFRDIIVLNSIEVGNLELNLELRADGSSNWRGARPSSPVSEDEQASKPAVIFNRIQITDTTLRYLGREKGLEHVLHIASLDQLQRSDGMLKIAMNGAFNDSPVELAGEIGPYAKLLNGRDVAYTGSVQVGTLKISGGGLIDDLLEPRRPEFTLEMEGSDIDKITAMLKVDDLGSGGFFLHANAAEVNGQYEAGLEGEIGDVSLSLTAQASDLSELNELNLTLAASGPSLGALTHSFGLENWPEKPFRLNGDISRIGGTLDISDLTLQIGSSQLKLDALLTNFPHLDASRVRLTVTGDDVAQFRELLGVPGIAEGPFTIRGTLDVSAEEVEQLRLQVSTSIGVATISGTLGTAPSYTGSKFHLKVDGNNAHTFMSAFNIDALPEQSFIVETRFETTDDGVLFKPGGQITIDNERLELSGLLALTQGGIGSDIELKLSGQYLTTTLGALVIDAEIPDHPYRLSGRVQVVSEGIQLENINAGFSNIKLSATGLIAPGDQLTGTRLNFRVTGENFSSLSEFSAIADSVDKFVPGQPYQATGQFIIKNDGWQLKDVSGEIGDTAFNFDGLLSKQLSRAGSSIRFSIDGPDMNGLLINQDDVGLPPGVFETSGQVLLSKDTLSIKELSFETTSAHGNVELVLGWPVEKPIDVDFNIDIRGDDIRQILPTNGSFKAKMANYQFKASGNKHGDLISLTQFSADIGDLQVSLEGELDDDEMGENVDISFSAATKDISTLGQLDGDDLPAMALDLKANISGNARQFSFRNLSATLGESQLEGLLDVSLKNQKPKIILTATSNKIDIRAFQDTDDFDDAAVAPSTDRLIPATPLPLKALAAADIAINLNIAELIHNKDSIYNLVLDAELQAGSLSIQQLSLDGPRGSLRSSFSINPTTASSADIAFDMVAENFILNLTGQSKDKLQQVPSVDIDMHVSGNGSTLQQVAGSVNGMLYLGSAGGTLEGVNLSVLDTFIFEKMASLIMPKKEVKDDLNLTCAATVLKITDGLVETDPAFAFTTDQITLIAKGTLDLKTEKMNFNFNATPNNALKISAGELFNPYILVGGTLGNPSVGLDPGKVLLHGGAAIGTAGLSILAKGLFDRVGNTTPLCEEMLKRAQQQ